MGTFAAGSVCSSGLLPPQSIDLLRSPHYNLFGRIKRWQSVGSAGTKHIFMLMGVPEGHERLLYKSHK